LGVNRKHAISLSSQKNFSARKEFDLDRIFEWLSISDHEVGVENPHPNQGEEIISL
jgi:hypothetical protein